MKRKLFRNCLRTINRGKGVREVRVLKGKIRFIREKGIRKTEKKVSLVYRLNKGEREVSFR